MTVPAVAIKVLVVDDSAVIRQTLTRHLDSVDGIDVIGSAPDPFEARDLIVELEPDVVVLDIEMPRMDGITFLKRIMAYKPTPVIICSSFSKRGSARAVEAMTAGAVDVVEKSSGPVMVQELSERIFSIGSKKLTAQAVTETGIIKSVRNMLRHDQRQLLIAIGASTGGIQALHSIISRFPSGMPGIVIVQHLPVAFTASFAGRLNEVSQATVREAVDGDVLKPDMVLIAPGDQHMEITRAGGKLRIGLNSGPAVNHHRPSVDVLFSSVARCRDIASCGVILTGMGADGAAGLLDMRRQGSCTIAQNEASSVVYGMPRVARENGAAESVADINEIPNLIVQWIEQQAEVEKHV